MIGNDLTMRLLANGLEAASLRQRVIANNLANVNTPGFKQSHVEFEQRLAEVLAAGENPDSVTAAVVKETTTTGRPDGNNVDVESATTTMAENQVWYAAMTRQLSDRYARLRTVIYDGRV